MKAFNIFSFCEKKRVFKSERPTSAPTPPRFHLKVMGTRIRVGVKQSLFTGRAGYFRTAATKTFYFGCLSVKILSVDRVCGN